MDLNLDTLKREILDYLASAGLPVFHSSPGGLEGNAMVLWDVNQYPDYQMFLEVARQSASKLVIFAAREFESADLDDLLEQLSDSDIPREEQREYESRLRDLRIFEGVTCTIELAFETGSRLYVYEVQPDWYEEFLNLDEEITSRISDEDLNTGDSLGGYFSRN